MQAEAAQQKEKTEQANTYSRGATDPAGFASDSLPVIIITNSRLRDISTSAMRALLKANHAKDDPFIFLYGKRWVRLLEDDTENEPLDDPALKGILDRVANFSVPGPKNTLLPARPPRDLAPDLFRLPDPGLPQLSGISTTPVFVEGGRLLMTNGYDRESGIAMRMKGLHDLRSDMPLAEALEWLQVKLMGQFPFVDDVDRAHALITGLERYVRYLIRGATPLHMLEAPKPGTGKNLLAEVLFRPPLGMPLAPTVLSKDDDEVDKRITARLLAGHAVILFDNLETIHSGALSAVLTSTFWAGRELGFSRTPQVPNQATWIATSNNPQYSSEIARRLITIRLDAQVARPELRTFDEKDLMSWTQAHRSDLVSAGISIVQAWVNAGMPKGDGIRLGGFEHWSDVMGGILKVAGIEGFLGDRDRIRSDADEEYRTWSAVCAAWWQQYNALPVTAGELFDTVLRPNRLMLEIWGGRDELSAYQRLGHKLAKVRDQIFDGWVVRGAGPDRRTKSNSYRLEVVVTEADTENPAPPTEPPTEAATENPAPPTKPPTEPPNQTEFEEQEKTNTCSGSAGFEGVCGVFSPTRDGGLKEEERIINNENQKTPQTPSNPASKNFGIENRGVTDTTDDDFPGWFSPDAAGVSSGTPFLFDGPIVRCPDCNGAACEESGRDWRCRRCGRTQPIE